MLLNQTRTLVAHLWENDGEPMSVTEQFLDSVNVPPPGPPPNCGRRSGLRYHALHHLLPGPALSCARRRRIAASRQRLGEDSAYHGANYGGLFPLVGAARGRRRGAAGKRLDARFDSSDRTSTISPMNRNSRNGAHAASNGG